MGANDTGEQLAAAQAECVRLERALITIRDLMEPTRSVAAVTTDPERYTVPSQSELYTAARTRRVRTALAAAGYPVTFTTAQQAQHDELMDHLTERGFCFACGAMPPTAHYPFCDAKENSHA